MSFAMPSVPISLIVFWCNKKTLSLGLDMWFVLQKYSCYAQFHVFHEFVGPSFLSFFISHLVSLRELLNVIDLNDIMTILADHDRSTILKSMMHFIIKVMLSSCGFLVVFE